MTTYVTSSLFKVTYRIIGAIAFDMFRFCVRLYIKIKFTKQLDFTSFIVVQCLLKKTSTLPLLNFGNYQVIT